MEVDLIPEKTCSVRVGHVKLDGFRVASEWEGFVKVVHPTEGELIVTRVGTNGFFSESFADIFLSIFGKEHDLHRRVFVVRASPSLIDKLSKGTIAKQEKPATA